jgi:hypothetical protein
MTREVIARAPPPAFLFPNQQCQRPGPPSGDPIVLRPMSAEAAIYPTPNSVSNRFSTKPAKPNRQTNPKANPTIRSALLKMSTNPVKQEFTRNSFMTWWRSDQILSNPFQIFRRKRLLVKAKPRVNFEFC